MGVLEVKNICEKTNRGEGNTVWLATDTQLDTFPLSKCWE